MTDPIEMIRTALRAALQQYRNMCSGETPCQQVDDALGALSELEKQLALANEDLIVAHMTGYERGKAEAYAAAIKQIGSMSPHHADTPRAVIHCAESGGTASDCAELARKAIGGAE